MKLYKDKYLKQIKTSKEDELIYTHYDKCKVCTCRCCEICPCELDPSDLKFISAQDIYELLLSGYVVIDSVYVDNNTFPDGLFDTDGERIYDAEIMFLRMRAYEDDDKFMSLLMFGGHCVALDSEDGCTIDFHHRPMYARLEDCDTPVAESSNIRSARAWLPYQDEIRKALLKLGIK